MILAGDVGGTKTNVALFEVVDGVPSDSSPWATAHADRSKTPAWSTAR